MDCGLSGLCIDEAELARLCNFACVEVEDATLAAAMAPPWLDTDMLMNCALCSDDGEVAADRVCLYAMTLVCLSSAPLVGGSALQSVAPGDPAVSPSGQTKRWRHVTSWNAT